jgi:DNA-directed RNA polymerase specialized sigma24 family protein
VTADDNLFERIPWLDVYKRLRATAGWVTRDPSVVFDAVSADDLVSETLLDFLRSPNALGWTPARGKLATFLCTVLRNKFIDHLRRHRRHAVPLEDPDLFAVQPERQLEQEEAVEQVMQCVRGRKDLEETVVAFVKVPVKGVSIRNWQTNFESASRRSSIGRNGFDGRVKPLRPRAKATKGATNPMSNDSRRLQGDGEALTSEKRAEDIMRSVLGLNHAELADVFRSQTSDDPTERLYDLATMAAAEYQARGEVIPAHVGAMLTGARQQQLAFEGLSMECSIPKILLVDAEGERMVSGNPSNRNRTAVRAKLL